MAHEALYSGPRDPILRPDTAPGHLILPPPRAGAPAPRRAARSAGGGDQVGPETCKACHAAAYEAWRTGPHARSLEGLPAESREDPRCLSCHAPDADEGLPAITCEACHGPGASTPHRT